MHIFFILGFAFLVRLFKNSINFFANELELKIYKHRQNLVLFGLFTLGSLVTAALLQNNFFGGLLINQKFIVKYLLILALVAILVLSEIYIKINNIFPNIITPGSRLFSLFPYIWVWLELTYFYSDFLFAVLKIVIDKPLAIRLIKIMAPILNFYGDIPLITNLLIFVLFFYGIGRNKETFEFFVRYHFIQSALFAILFAFESHLLGRFIELTSYSKQFYFFLGATIYCFNFFILFWTILSVIFARKTHLPFLHNSVQYHLGKIA